MGLEKRLEKLEVRHGAGDTTIFVVDVHDEDYNPLPAAERERRLEEVRAKAGPGDVVFIVECDEVTDEQLADTP